jgi:hypothetical protein
MRRCAPRRTPECLPTYGTSGGTLNRAGVGALWCPRARCSHAVAPLPIGRPTRRHRPTNTPHPEQTKRADGVGLCACPLAWVCTVACVRGCARANGWLPGRLCGCWACCCGCPAYNRVGACARLCVLVSECRCVLVCVRVRGSVSECTRVCVCGVCA